MRPKLRVESIPAGTWGLSLANRLPKEEWNDIRQSIYKGAGYRCEICGEDNAILHCHERWAFRKTGKNKGVQRLVGLVCLCSLCHDCTHFGRSTQVYGKDYVEVLMKHMQDVNGISKDKLLVYLEEAKRINYERADIDWTVKIGRKVLV